jgi:hypothetical protein
MMRKPKTMTKATPWTHPFEIASSARVGTGRKDCSVIATPQKESLFGLGRSVAINYGT